ncbi:hypothetical protein CAEBREN_24207 [Caenorhabditis brenneri]|uniref:Receptor expression-enhancing protein n=1 Tax=Caenorhabditis brenneri TaxID=135651 RepID=G0N717_CAEBE|nr:hypothetical protein CAEBREN_24207 [Caenorhabditis brenneri]
MLYEQNNYTPLIAEIERVTGRKREHCFYAALSVILVLILLHDAVGAVTAFMTLILPTFMTVTAISSTTSYENPSYLKNHQDFFVRYWTVYAVFVTCESFLSSLINWDLRLFRLVFLSTCLSPRIPVLTATYKHDDERIDRSIQWGLKEMETCGSTGRQKKEDILASTEKRIDRSIQWGLNGMETYGLTGRNKGKLFQRLDSKDPWTTGCWESSIGSRIQRGSLADESSGYISDGYDDDYSKRWIDCVNELDGMELCGRRKLYGPSLDNLRGRLTSTLEHLIRLNSKDPPSAAECLDNTGYDEEVQLSNLVVLYPTEKMDCQLHESLDTTCGCRAAMVEQRKPTKGLVKACFSIIIQNASLPRGSELHVDKDSTAHHLLESSHQPHALRRVFKLARHSSS